ncbi:MAG: DUF5615 family PIN-like protein [Chloroflexi bacterium]|nr:DUF5615 family PIN-like protein [Chloroflexota bacterium]
MADFYVDHNVAREIAVRLQLAGHQARTAQDQGLERAGDDEPLFTAAQWGWILLTHNARDFHLLHDAWRRWSHGWQVSARHAGILILLPPISPMQAVETIAALLQSGQPLPNELHTWRPRQGWMRRP